MKNYLLILLGTLMTISLFAQQKAIDVPAAATSSFQKAFPGATKVKWEKEENDYEVLFTFGNKEMSAVYTASGAMMEKEESMEAKELPATIRSYIKQHYKGATIKEAAKIIKQNGVVNYEAEVNEQDVLFDQNGKFLKEVKE